MVVCVCLFWCVDWFVCWVCWVRCLGQGQAEKEIDRWVDMEEKEGREGGREEIGGQAGEEG